MNIDDLIINGEYITTIAQFRELISKMFGHTMSSKDKLRLQGELICLTRDGIVWDWIKSLENVEERLAECFSRIAQTPDISDDEILSELASACGGKYNATVENASCFSLANSKCECKGEKYEFSFKFDINIYRRTQSSFFFIIKKEGRDVFRAEQMRLISGVPFELAFSVPQYFEADYLLFVEGRETPIYQVHSTYLGVPINWGSEINAASLMPRWIHINKTVKKITIRSINESIPPKGYSSILSGRVKVSTLEMNNKSILLFSSPCSFLGLDNNLGFQHFEGTDLCFATEPNSCEKFIKETCSRITIKKNEHASGYTEDLKYEFRIPTLEEWLFALSDGKTSLVYYDNHKPFEAGIRAQIIKCPNCGINYLQGGYELLKDNNGYVLCGIRGKDSNGNFLLSIRKDICDKCPPFCFRLSCCINIDGYLE